MIIIKIRIIEWQQPERYSVENITYIRNYTCWGMTFQGHEVSYGIRSVVRIFTHSSRLWILHFICMMDGRERWWMTKGVAEGRTDWKCSGRLMDNIQDNMDDCQVRDGWMDQRMFTWLSASKGCFRLKLVDSSTQDWMTWTRAHELIGLIEEVRLYGRHPSSFHPSTFPNWIKGRACPLILWNKQWICYF